MTDPTTIEPAARLALLEQYFRDLGSVLVCYSGGVDSALVLAAAHRALGDRAVGLLAISPSLASAEQQQATELAQQLGVELQVLPSGEMSDADYVANRPDRCYHCKRELYRLAHEERQRLGLAAVVNGANADDLSDHRPGHQAADEAGAQSPLLELGFTKADVRAVARQLGLPVWDKPAAACLSSRLPYGTEVTAERLHQVAGFEAALKQLGFRQVRVRYHGELARIELGPDELSRAAEPELARRIVAAGQDHDFRYITLDLQGYRQGSHNEVLGETSGPGAE